MPIKENEYNKKIVADFYKKIWEEKNISLLSDFISEDYIQHNPNIANGRKPLIDFLTGFFQSLPESSFKVVRLIAENDLVVAHCLFKMNDDDRGMAVVDIYRIENGKLVEHWDLKESIPEESANGNSMV